MIRTVVNIYTEKHVKTFKLTEKSKHSVILEAFEHDRTAQANNNARNCACDRQNDHIKRNLWGIKQNHGDQYLPEIVHYTPGDAYANR